MHLNLKYYCFFWMLIACPLASLAQEKDKKVDSTKMYRDIEKYSKKSKVTKFLHKLIFEPVAKEKVKKSKFQKTITTNYASFECKIIRNIEITTLDPFGYSEKDTLKKPKKFNDRIGNALHYKTRAFTISNWLLIKKNQPLDSLLVKETERLIRSQRYVRGVASRIELTSPNSDSVDVYIRVLDAWSLVPEFSTSTSASTFRLTERNFMGLGHQLSGTYRQSLTGSENSYSTGYTIPTLFKTFIRTSLNYQKEVDGSFGRFINIERPFFSNYSHWAGGIYLDQQFRKLTPTTGETTIQSESFKYNSQDYWLGYSCPVFDGKSERDRATNFFISGRHLTVNYLEKPSESFDPSLIFSSEKSYYGSIGLSSRTFKQDKYLFDFNVTEDIASGFIYSLTAGNQHKNGLDRLYLGGRVAIGKFFPFGYFSTNFEYGTFFRGDRSEQTTLNWSLVYFTNLFEIGKWKFRQFVKPQLVVGINRLPTDLDRLNLTGEYGIQGFDSTFIKGTKKLVVNFQTQSYSPWNLLGFRLNPYLSYTMGLLSNSTATFKGSKIYSQIGAGVIVSNDFLVFNSFQFSFSYFPSIPNDGTDIFKTNSIRTYDLTLPNFEVTKPSIILYQ